jgi:hypothetical protein
MSCLRRQEIMSPAGLHRFSQRGKTRKLLFSAFWALVLGVLILGPMLAVLPKVSYGLGESYIVQAASAASAGKMVYQVGGMVTHDLKIIQAVAARLNPAQVERLQKITGVKIFRDHVLTTSGATETVSDTFSARRYDNHTGTKPWKTNWAESGETTNPTSGYIQVLSSYYLQIKYNNRAISRSVDLSTAANAILSFKYRRVDDFASNYVSLQISSDGGGNWAELARFTGPGQDSGFVAASYDISAYRNANTVIRFMTSYSLGSKTFYVDDVTIQYTLPDPTPTPTPIPPTPTPIPPTPTSPRPLVLDQNMRDNFHGYSYNNNDGNTFFSGPWTETWESDGFGAGRANLKQDSDSIACTFSRAWSG